MNIVQGRDLLPIAVSRQKPIECEPIEIVEFYRTSGELLVSVEEVVCEPIDYGLVLVSGTTSKITMHTHILRTLCQSLKPTIKPVLPKVLQENLPQDPAGDCSIVIESKDLDRIDLFLAEQLRAVGEHATPRAGYVAHSHIYSTQCQKARLECRCPWISVIGEPGRDISQDGHHGGKGREVLRHDGP